MNRTELEAEVRRLAAAVDALQQLVGALTLEGRFRGLASRVADLEGAKSQRKTG